MVTRYFKRIVNTTLELCGFELRRITMQEGKPVYSNLDEQNIIRELLRELNVETKH